MQSQDALIVVPPLSPSDTNPSLGPYLLRTVAENSGLRLRVCDLSIAYLRTFGESEQEVGAPLVGDRDKDRGLIGRAKAHFLEFHPLRGRESFMQPCCVDPLLGMHFRFEDIEDALRESERRGYWASFLESRLFGRFHEPAVLGFSIMGPQQVCIALLAARMARRIWPRSRVVAGGSHVTLLETEIRNDPRYGRDLGGFFAGHSEQELAGFVTCVLRGSEPVQARGHFRAGQGSSAHQCTRHPVTIRPTVRGRGVPFEIVPTFDQEDLELFSKQRLTIPMQLSRGCAFGKCTMCTYPAVEPELISVDDWQAVGDTIHLLTARHGVHRFSFKDSFFTVPRLRQLADLLFERGLGITWSATTIMHESLNPRLLAKLRQAGCRTLEYGLETIWPEGQRRFGKLISLDRAEKLIADTASAGIVANINLIYGLPGELREQADRQLQWFLSQCGRYPGLVSGSHNMLELNRAAPLAGDAANLTKQIAPWAFSYVWDAPHWRAEFLKELRGATE